MARRSRRRQPGVAVVLHARPVEPLPEGKLVWCELHLGGLSDEDDPLLLPAPLLAQLQS